MRRQRTSESKHKGLNGISPIEARRPKIGGPINDTLCVGRNPWPNIPTITRAGSVALARRQSEKKSRGERRKPTLRLEAGNSPQIDICTSPFPRRPVSRRRCHKQRVPRQFCCFGRWPKRCFYSPLSFRAVDFFGGVFVAEIPPVVAFLPSSCRWSRRRVEFPPRGKEALGKGISGVYFHSERFWGSLHIHRERFALSHHSAVPAFRARDVIMLWK